MEKYSNIVAAVAVAVAVAVTLYTDKESSLARPCQRATSVIYIQFLFVKQSSKKNRQDGGGRRIAAAEFVMLLKI